MPLLDDATILITGASSGLGAEFARQLAPRARCLILAARRLDRLQELAAQIGRNGLEIRCLPVDLANADDLEQFITEVRTFPINVLINNAGLGDHGLFEDSKWERVDAMIQVNIRALSRLTGALVKDLLQRERAGILNVSSIASLVPLPQMAIYAATKAFVTSFSEALRAEMRGTAVNVTALCPGPVNTEFFEIAERPSSDASQAAPEVMKVPATVVVAQGLTALERNRPLVIPGWFPRLVMTATTLTPAFIRRYFLNRRGRGYTGH
jgi:short-subunit dehydrogenase